MNTNVAECVIAEGLVEQVKYLYGLGWGMFAGLAPRLTMTSLMTGIQFNVYEAVKEQLHVAGPLPLPAPVAIPPPVAIDE
mmetsp:Transcript_150317/g.280354  ORF Transcript_150317/g.280354 Transcript_150317/m.280354 type:complete len:80 (+) Transcript_150317:2-241(+)